mgnify:CR=1 FL=1|jgi:hypothetical protein
MRVVRRSRKGADFAVPCSVSNGNCFLKWTMSTLLQGGVKDKRLKTGKEDKDIEICFVNNLTWKQKTIKKNHL